MATIKFDNLGGLKYIIALDIIGNDALKDDLLHIQKMFGRGFYSYRNVEEQVGELVHKLLTDSGVLEDITVTVAERCIRGYIEEPEKETGV